MRKSRFSDEQMLAILRESDRTSVAEAAAVTPWLPNFVNGPTISSPVSGPRSRDETWA